MLFDSRIFIEYVQIALLLIEDCPAVGTGGFLADIVATVWARLGIVEAKLL